MIASGRSARSGGTSPHRELTEGLEHVLSREHRDAAPVVAGAALLAFDVTIDSWQRNHADVPLGDLIDAELRHLARLATLR